MSGVLKDLNPKDSSPDLFYSVDSSEALQIALRVEQSCLWVACARKQSPTEAALDFKPTRSSSPTTAWLLLPELSLAAGNGFSIEPITKRIFCSSGTNPTVAIRLPSAQWLAKLCKSKTQPPKSLIEDWASQVQQLCDLASSAQGSVANDSSNYFAKPIATFAVTDTALLIDLESLVESALLTVENHKLVGQHATDQPDFTDDVLAKAQPYSSSGFSSATLGQLLVDTGVHGKAGTHNQDLNLVGSTAVTLKREPRADVKARSSKITVALSTKTNWWQTRNFIFGSSAAAAVAIILGGFLLFQSPSKKSVADAGKSTKVTATQPEQNAAPKNANVEVESTELDLTGAVPRDASTSESIPLPSTTAIDSMTSLSGPTNNELPEINIESLLTPEPETQPTSEARTQPDSGMSFLDEQSGMTKIESLGELPGSAESVLPKSNEKLFDEDAPESEDPVTDATDTQTTDPPASQVKRQIVSLNKPLVKLTTKGPEGLVRTSASALVVLKPIEGLMVEPNTPWVITGRVSDERTLYRSEEGAAIKIYVKSNPSSSWKMQFAPRLRITSQIEIAVDEKIVFQALQQLAEMNVNLSAQLNMLSQLRNHPRANRTAFNEAEGAIKSRITEVEQMIERLHDASALIDLFKNMQDAEVFLACSADQLPQPEVKAEIEEANPKDEADSE